MRHTQSPARVIQGVKFIMKMFSRKNKSARSACFLPWFGSRSAGDKEELRAPSCRSAFHFRGGSFFERFVYTCSLTNITVKK